MQFSLVNVVPNYFTCASHSKDLLAVCMMTFAMQSDSDTHGPFSVPLLVRQTSLPEFLNSLSEAKRESRHNIIAG